MATRPPPTCRPAAPLWDEDDALALAPELALADVSVLEAVANPVWTAVLDVPLVAVVAAVLVADAVPYVVVEPYTEAALQYCSRCCWTVETPGSLGQLL